MNLPRRFLPLAICATALSLALIPASAQSRGPWMKTSLSPDERAALVLKEMTIDEKISLLHGTGMKDLSPMSPLAIHSNGGAGYVVGFRVWASPPSKCRTQPTVSEAAERMDATPQRCRAI